MKKSWIKSKTIIFNGLGLLVLAAKIVADVDISEKTTAIAVAVFGIGNILLRFKTTEPIQ
jgi:hypothetical protein